MTVDSLIKETLAPLGHDIEKGVYLGKDAQYFTFGYAAIGDDYADDTPSHERYLVYIEFHSQHAFNTNPVIRKAKQALLKAGFTWPSETDSSNATGRLVLLECEIALGVDPDGDI